MLLLEKKSFSGATTSSVLSGLVDLALVTSMSVFDDILGIFSMYSREYLQDNDTIVWTTVRTRALCRDNKKKKS
jgi:phosphatidylinositol 4-kinase